MRSMGQGLFNAHFTIYFGQKLAEKSQIEVFLKAQKVDPLHFHGDGDGDGDKIFFGGDGDGDSNFYMYQ